MTNDTAQSLLAQDYAVSGGDAAQWVAQQAVRALLYEVSVTPKPGLVDRANTGAHTDMDFFTFLDSAAVLSPYFARVTQLAAEFPGEPETLLQQLRQPGIDAEETMLRATGGINTHKGAIYSLGILCAACGCLQRKGVRPSLNLLLETSARIGRVKEQELRELPTQKPLSNGEKLYRQYGLGGIRGEVAAGFPNLRQYGYPVLSGLLNDGISPDQAGLVALLHLIARVNDTNMIKRAGMKRFQTVQARVGETLATENDVEKLMAYAVLLDKEFIRQHISPGGCADLLAAAFFCYFLLEPGAAGRHSL